MLGTDGFNTASAVSQPFSVPTKAPSTAIITEPTGEPYQNPVGLEGTAYDPEYGFLPEDRMTWSSDLDGEIGIGSSIEAQLSPGEHTITLVGEDAHGMMSRAVIQITVAEFVEDEPLTGMGSGLQSLWFIGFLILAALMGSGVGLDLVAGLDETGGINLLPLPGSSICGVMPGMAGQQGMTQDSQGRWWYQDPNTGAWSIWNGTAWQRADPGHRAAARPTPGVFTPPPAVVQSKPRGGSSCLFTIIIFAVLALVVLGGITLVAFNFFPGTEIQPGTGRSHGDPENGRRGFAGHCFGRASAQWRPEIHHHPSGGGRRRVGQKAREARLQRDPEWPGQPGFWRPPPGWWVGTDGFGFLPGSATVFRDMIEG